MEVLLERKENEEFQGWTNIPKNHSSIQPEIISKIQKFQYLQQVLQDQSNISSDLRNELLKEYETLKEELVEYQSTHGEEFFLLLGDSGGGSFKLMLQHLNTAKPNSTHSGLIVGYMEAKDNEENLRIAFPNLQSQLDMLQDCKIDFELDGEKKTKTVRIFLGGDYEFLTLIFGHGGACSLNFCLFCPCQLASKSDDPLTMNPEETWDKKERSLDDLKKTTNKEPILKFPLHRVVILPLHIVLGLTKEYLSIFMKEIRELDVNELNIDELENQENENKRTELYKKLEETKDVIQEIKEDIILLSEMQQELQKIEQNCQIIKRKVEGKNLLCQAAFEGKKDHYCSSAGKHENEFLCGKHKGKGGERVNEMKELKVELEERIKKVEKNENLLLDWKEMCINNSERTLDVLKIIILENNQELNQIKEHSQELEKTLQLKNQEQKDIEREFKLCRGKREICTFEVFEQLGVSFQPLYGEFTMTGGSCKKLLEGSEKFLEVIQDKKDLHIKFKTLFESFCEIRRILYQIAPFKVEEIEEIKKTLFEFGHFFCSNFLKNPIPKHHFLIFHVVAWLERYLSIGMFAEQGVESVHGVMNALERKLAPLAQKERVIRKIQEQHLKTIFNH